MPFPVVIATDVASIIQAPCCGAIVCRLDTKHSLLDKFSKASESRISETRIHISCCWVGEKKVKTCDSGKPSARTSSRARELQCRQRGVSVKTNLVT
ncbi:hypothetical protein LSAT2_018694 [Lamellibrachia satsuma]|nr:hypothetical protein LSAT2_018694 [Lamellibrachia satsuma]